MAQEDSTNYSFLLKCLAAVTAAALFIAGIIAAASLKSGAAASFMLASSTASFAPIIPIALACIGLVCLLAYLCSDNNNTTVHMGGPRPYGGAFFSNGYSPAFRNYYSGGSTTYVSGARPYSAASNTHSHFASPHIPSHSVSSNTHGHSVSSNMHGHSVSSNMHGHH